MTADSIGEREFEIAQQLADIGAFGRITVAGQHRDFGIAEAVCFKAAQVMQRHLAHDGMRRPAEEHDPLALLDGLFGLDQHALFRGFDQFPTFQLVGGVVDLGLDDLVAVIAGFDAVELAFELVGVGGEVGELPPPAAPRARGFRRYAARRRRHRLRVDWYTRRAGDLGRRSPDYPWHRGLYRDPQELRPGGPAGGSHLFLVDRQGTNYVDCSHVELPFGPQLVQDIQDRTETAMGQAHCFLAAELALRAQAGATRLGAGDQVTR